MIPRLGITGAAIGWAAAIGLTNLVPLVQVAVAARVHPFGLGTAAACGLTLVSFGAVPLALRAAAGSSPVVSVGSALAGCVLMALGLWRLQGLLNLAKMPGFGRLRRTPRGASPAGASRMDQA